MGWFVACAGDDGACGELVLDRLVSPMLIIANALLGYNANDEGTPSMNSLQQGGKKRRRGNISGNGKKGPQNTPHFQSDFSAYCRSRLSLQGVGASRGSCLQNVYSLVQ